MLNKRLAVAASAILLATAPLAYSAEKTAATLSVSATGTANTRPDTAQLSLTVLREAKTASAAMAENNKAMAEVMAAMLDFAGNQDHLQTTGISLAPRYRKLRNSSGETPQIGGYSASNTLQVTIPDPSQAGKALDRAVKLGVNTGGSIYFYVKDPTPHKEAARVDAVKRALTKARTIAKAADITILRILDISEQHSGGPSPLARAQTRSFAEDAVPVAAGLSSYSVTISVRFEIGE